jgi:ATP-binding cassette, subfamily B, bacterial
MCISLHTYSHLLRQYLGPQRAAVALMAALLLASIGFQLAGPQLARRFIDAARAGCFLH